MLSADKCRYIWGFQFKEISDHLIFGHLDRIDPAKVKRGDIIYLDPNFRSYFVKQVAPYIQHSYILITPDSDIPAPGDYGFSLLDDPRLIAWFSINVEGCAHPKLHPMPLGSRFLYLSNDIADKVYDQKDHLEKKHLLYLNVTIQTFSSERQLVHDLFSARDYCYAPSRKPFEEYLVDLASSKFVLSPRGTGLDCFRTWEALYLGAIPIVRSSSLNPVYEDLPILVIDEWEEITEEFLLEKYEEMQHKTYSLEKLDPSYWLNLIQSYQTKAR